MNRVPIEEVKANLAWSPLAIAGAPIVSKAGNILMRRLRSHIVGQTWLVVLAKARIDAEYFPRLMRFVKP